MLRQTIKALGKSILIVAGVGYGMVKAMDLLAQDSLPDLPAARPGRPPAVSVPAPRTTSLNDHPPIRPYHAADSTLQRLESMEERLVRMEHGIEMMISLLERTPSRPQQVRSGESFVTRTALNTAMEQLASRLESEIERRFEVQNRAVQSLRTMVARTDELLEQVIESIESTSLTA